RPVRQVRDEVFNLLAGGFAQGLRPTEVDGVSLDQGGIQLVLADDLAQTVADFGAAVIAIGRLWREFLRISGGLRSFSEGPDLLCGADADAVGLSQSAVHSPCFCHAHLSASHEKRNIGGVSVAIANKASASRRLVDCCLKCPS